MFELTRSNCCLSLLAVLLLAFSTNMFSFAAPDDDDENRYPEGAPLKTDPELERLLARAEKFASEGRFDLASILWQKVLEDSSDTLMTRDGRVYTTLAVEVERTIAKLPPTGLRVYRITADGEAKALLADGKDENREEAQSNIVKKYFLSSLGDDAAYELGCLALDRYDFVGATRLFKKILDQHPDPSISKAEIWMRLAVAAAHVGDSSAAGEAIKQMKDSSDDLPSEEVIAAVEKDIARISDSSITIASSSDNWNMTLGGPARRGHMRKLPDAVTKATLTKAWNYHFPMNFTSATQNNAQGRYLRKGPIAVEPLGVDPSGKGLINRWKNGGWMPSGQLLISGGKIFFKTNNDLTCWDASAEDDQPAWRTAWLNQFKPDAKTAMMSQMFKQMGVQVQGRNRPTSAAEVMLFGDRVHQSFSISNGVIFSIEGRRVPRHGGGAVVAASSAQQPWRFGQVPRRTRQNWLASYDIKTGKAKWYRSPSEKEKSDGTVDRGFMAAPVPYGNFLLVPVTDAGAMWLYALNKNDGSTVWKSYLCDEPAGGCEAWSPIGVSIDGREAYVVCGSGVVFAVDAVSGDIRFAVRYERSGKPSQMMRNFGRQGAQMKDLVGWKEDIAIPFGHQLVVFASDHDGLFAIDRRTGKELWYTPRTPYQHASSYCMGVIGAKMIVGGKNVVRRYDLDKDGKLMWELEFDDSYGRGVLTEDAVFVPVKDSIVRIDLETGKKTAQVGVHLSTETDPVGNLYSDGEKLWVLSGNNVYALTNRDQRLAVLADRIREGNVDAFLERMQLLAKDGQLDAAVKDLVDAFEVISAKQGQETAFSTLLGGINLISLPTTKPESALDLVGRFCVDVAAESGSKVEADDALTMLDGIVYASLQTIRKNEAKGHVSPILQIAPVLKKTHQLICGRQALKATATEDDAASLQKVIAEGELTAKLIAIEALAHVKKDGTKGVLTSLLESDEELVRHMAARGLAVLGEPSSLTALVSQLGSDNPRIRLQSVQVLRSLTGQTFDYPSYADKARRAAGLKAWRDWVADNGATAELKLPLPDTEPMLGRTLITFYNHNRIVELNASGKEVWRKDNIQGPWAVQGLPNGHRVVSLYGSNAVVEFDENGKEIWRKDGLPGQPFGVQRLLNGNTLVACSDSQRVIEYRANGEVAWQATVSNRPMDARRLENGNTLVACSGDHRIVEVDSAGKEVWELRNMQGPISAQRLDNGNTLVVQMSGRKVVEVDREGTVIWTRANLTNPYDAQRLPNGNTIIGDQNGVKEYDAKGNVVWQHAGKQVSGVSRY